MNEELFEMPGGTGPEEHKGPVLQEVLCRVHGKVQGVMFRDFVSKLAEKFQVKGYVKNMDDGSVEVLAQGNEHDLARLVEHLHHGSSTARVTEVEEEWRKPEKAYLAFDIAQ